MGNNAKYDLPEPYNCKECGERITRLPYLDAMRERLRVNEWCFTCGFWHEKIDLKDDPLYADFVTRVDGKHYLVVPCTRLHPRLRGHSGAEFKVRYFDGRKVTTDNLWYQGEIPQRFRDRLPDNAEFIK